jgi:hypothetical protein
VGVVGPLGHRGRATRVGRVGALLQRAPMGRTAVTHTVVSGNHE